MEKTIENAVKKVVELDGKSLDIETVHRISLGGVELKIKPAAVKSMQTSRDYIEKQVAAGEVIYGVNTGFGAFSSVRISDAEVEQLQKNLIRSHSCGVGEPFTKAQTRAIMVLRANALVRGHSGVRPLVVERLLQFLNADVIPWIPSQGSVGASGDLAPLAHLALCLIGEGKGWGRDGHFVPISELLQEKKLEPLTLKSKEGLSLINGCQVMTAVGMLATYRAQRCLHLFDLVGAMSLEALRGSRSAFDPLIAATRPHPGEAKTARNLLKLMGPSSAIAKSHDNCSKVQDAYSLRCMPAVHGAAKDTISNVAKTLEIEANSSTDNPLVFAEEGKILSCGNFHGEPVAFAMDFAAIAMSALANISECRIQKLVNPAMSDLPAFLAPKGGLNSGHMIVQVAAASLVSENKILSHPASVDSIPTSADKEDHVSMGTIAARKFTAIIKNAEQVLAMELLSATQALDLLKPLEPAAAVLAIHREVRHHVPFADVDRNFGEDIHRILHLIETDRLSTVLEQSIGKLEL